VFLLMLVFNIYWSRRPKASTPAPVPSTKPESSVPVSKMESETTSSGAVPQPRRRVDGILGAQELLNSLRYFMTIWEQYGASDMRAKWRPHHTKDMYVLSRSLVDLPGKYPGSWDFGLVNQVKLTSGELERLASVFQAGKFEEATVHGEAAYGLAKALISFLESQKT